MISLLILVSCGVVNVLSGTAISLYECPPADDVCVTKAVKIALPLVLNENSAIGAEELDPMYQREIDGNLSVLKFKLFNTTVTGFRECNVERAKYDYSTHILRVELLCPGFTLEGQYDIKGRLVVLPVEGNGDYTIVTQKFRLIVDLELNIINKNDKIYKHVTSYKVKAEPLEPVTFDFRNLFNGQKDLAETILKFANENWKDVTKEVQDPVFKANIKKVIKNANKYLRTLTIDDYISE